jgi:thiamine pyrophosphokinase
MSGQNISHCLIVCDGTISKRLLNKFIKNNDRSSYALIAADGASDFLFKHEVIPDYVIGDLDSVSPETLQAFQKERVIVKKIAEQDHNDLEKCIMFALYKEWNKITVIGYGGKRIDHTINNFSILKKYYSKSDIRFIDDEFEVFAIDKSIQFKYKVDDVISLQGFPKAEGINTTGLQYELNNVTLEYGVKEGALNKSVKDTVKISLRDGVLLVFRKLGKLI